MVAKYTEKVDLAKNSGYLQSYIKAQIEVRFYVATCICEGYESIANRMVIVF